MAASKLTPVGKITFVVLAIGLAFGAYRMFGDKVKTLLGGGSTASVVPKHVDLPALTVSAGEGTNLQLNTISDDPAPVTGQQMRMLVWAWNAQSGLMLANGGAKTTRGSLMEQLGVNLKLTRQDDATKMQEALVAFAQELKNGNPNPSKGAHFVAIMGDGAAAFLTPLNAQLRRLGPEYTAKVIGSCGYSRGEDKFMGPREWKNNPQLARGGVVSGYLRDGDWNIALKWCGDNNIKNNPDEKTWDPDALNWVAANDYIDAAEKYIAGYSEERKVVKNGKPTGETKRITVQGVVTWTPGDVNVADKKGGIVSIISTREYASQMPNTIIGIDKWMKDNRKSVESYLAGIFAGGDAIKSSDAALQKAAQISAEVYQEQGADASYWYTYFKGTTKRDAQGLMVELGGSSVNNLADNMLLYGLVPGSQNLFAATYSTFGDVVVQQYPNLVPSYDPVESILDTSYVKAVASRANPTLRSAQVAQASPHYEDSGAPIQPIGSKSSWRVFFTPGQTFIPDEGSRVLRATLNDLLVASGAVVEIRGYADGAKERNSADQLSEERAFAVKRWFEKQAPVNFPAGRIKVTSFGSSNPLEPNSVEGSKMNRRVEIVLGTR
ncbi:MAG: OmpA family protein [Armatimonadetes bacterium]|nr:OmpA family protein [Armatimonadota bacterium]